MKHAPCHARSLLSVGYGHPVNLFSQPAESISGADSVRPSRAGSLPGERPARASRPRPSVSASMTLSDRGTIHRTGASPKPELEVVPAEGKKLWEEGSKPDGEKSGASLKEEDWLLSTKKLASAREKALAG